MDEQTMEALEQRLYRVELCSRRWKWATAIILGGIVSGVLVGQSARSAVTPVLEAERFVLRDAQGKARAWFETSNGSVNLALADRDEKSRAFLYVRADGSAGLALYDKTSTRRGGLYVSADGSPSLDLADKDGKASVQLKLGPDGLPSVSLVDRDGRRVGLFILPDGRPAVGLVDATAKLRAALDLGRDGEARVILSDKGATERAELAVLSDGTPRLSLIGHAGRLTWHGP
jgi:hypothetical protein